MSKKKIIILVVVFIVVISSLVLIMLPSKECDMGDVIYPGAIKNCYCVGIKSLSYQGLGRFITCKGILIKDYYK